MLSKSQIKYIQSLGHKKCRDEEGLFMAEGSKIIAEFLKDKNCVIKHIYALKEWISEHETEINCEFTEVSQQELERISQLKTPNKVFAVAEKIKWGKEQNFNNGISLALETIQDPGNMGTIIRLADWFGIKQIICSPDCADIYNPKVVQATMASIARVRIELVELKLFLEKNKELQTYAAVLGGEDVSTLEKINTGIIIIGNESKGISEEILTMVKKRITIKGNGKAESLNAAIATGIILSHLT
jgi:TrmH family RNA methyltransferase